MDFWSYFRQRFSYEIRPFYQVSIFKAEDCPERIWNFKLVRKTNHWVFFLTTYKVNIIYLLSYENSFHHRNFDEQSQHCWNAFRWKRKHTEMHSGKHTVTVTSYTISAGKNMFKHYVINKLVGMGVSDVYMHIVERLSKNCWSTYRQLILTLTVSAYHFLIG